MAVSKEFLEDVLDDLRGLGAIHAKRMFSGYGLYCDEHFFGLCSQDTLYFKVDEAGREECLAAGIDWFDPRADGKGLASYFVVSFELRRDSVELKRWFQRAVKAAASKQRTPKKGLAALRNIGPVSRRWLVAVGVKSRADLEKRGVIAVWKAVRKLEGKVSVNLLYALEGARTDRRWTELSPAERRSLKQRAGLEN